MTDLSSLSDEQLSALYNQGQGTDATRPLSAWSDEELKAAYNQPRPILDKLASFAKNVYNNPPPTIAGIRDVIKGAPAAANELTFGSDPEAATGAAGTMFKAAMLGANPMARSTEGVLAAPMARREPIAIPEVPARPAPPAPITAADLKVERGANYKAATAANVEIAAPAASDTYNATLAQIAKNFEPSQAPSTFKILSDAATRYSTKQPDALQAMTGVGARESAPATGAEIEAIQQRLQAIKPNATYPADNAAAKQARAMIDEALSSMPDSAILKGDAQAFRDAIAAGRGNTAALYRMKALEAGQERGALNAETASSGGNVENTGRQAFKSLVRPPVSGGPTPAQRIGFNAPEQQAIRDVAAPGLLRGTIRGVGQLAPTDPWRLLASAEAAKLSGGLTIPLTAASYGAKKLGDSLMQKSVQNAMNLTSMRSPLYRSQMARFQREMEAYKLAAAARARAQAQNGGILAGLGSAQPAGLLGAIGQQLPQ